jgi:hypothetical protein
MAVYDKLPKGMRQALQDADHNWSGEQLYRAYKAKHPKVKTVVLAVAFLKEEDRKKHVRDTADFNCGIMPGQRGEG